MYEGTLFFTQIILFSFFGGKIEPSGWLSEEVIAFKILQSCLYQISLMETGKEKKWRLWQPSKKCWEYWEKLSVNGIFNLDNLSCYQWKINSCLL